MSRTAGEDGTPQDLPLFDHPPPEPRQGALFDVPATSTEEDAPVARKPRGARSTAAPAPVATVTDDTSEPVEAALEAPVAGPRLVTSPAPSSDDAIGDEIEGTAVSWSQRLLAGLVDLAVHGVVLLVMLGATIALGVRPDLGAWPSFALLMLAFSFPYWVIPLAFWGQTPGMAWLGHGARALDDEPLTFGQAMLRWLGALLTAALVGLPLALALGGSSMSDRLSQSKTVPLVSA